MMFDYLSFARQHKVDQDTLEQILSELNKEFPGDEMMIELHAIRIIKHLYEQKHRVS